MTEQVKLFNAALDEHSDSPTGIVMRGALDLHTLQHLKVDEYQRDAQKYETQHNILDALEHNDRLPDVELGCRGTNYTGRGTDFVLSDNVFIIDGLQRITTIIEFLARNPDKKVSIGAIVHFNTSRAWEKDRFHKLNNNRIRISPNILLRNMRDKNKALLTLYGLSVADSEFALYERVSWEQHMRRNELMTALVLTKTANRLHGHINPSAKSVMTKGGGRGSAGVEDVSQSLLRKSEEIGLQVMRENVVEFFDILDSMWGVRNIQYKEKAHYIKGTFLITLAKLFSDHKDFWSPKQKLFVSLPMRRKIHGFPLNEPYIERLCGSGGRALDELYEKLCDHVNSGKRTHRLKNRYRDKAA